MASRVLGVVGLLAEALDEVLGCGGSFDLFLEKVCQVIELLLGRVLHYPWGVPIHDFVWGEIRLPTCNSGAI